ncbi:hypothetical protein FI667_g7068, partial [Globisporangium splendens]
MAVAGLVTFAAAVVFGTATVDAATLTANANSNVCDFAATNLYVRDATQTAFPPGYLSCIGADQQTLARCTVCNCRDKQSASTGGVTVEWGLCIEGNDACVTSQTPDRKFCGNITESGASFNPGRVSGANTDGTVVSTPMPASSGDVEQLASSSTALTSSSGKGSNSSYIVAGCAVAGVAAVAMFAVARKRQTDPDLGTPVQDSTYGNNNTSKAKSNMLTESQLMYKNRLSERMSGESVLDADYRMSNDHQHMTIPASGYGQQHNQPASQFSAPPPSYSAVPPVVPAQARAANNANIARESSFFGSLYDEDDEAFSVAEGSPPQHSGFESIAYGKGQSNKPNFDSSFISIDDNSEFGASAIDFSATGRSDGTVDFSATARTEDIVDFSATARTEDIVDFSATARSDGSVFDTRSTSVSVESNGLTMYERDTEASEILRESTDSVMFSDSKSSLSFFAEEGSPRKSIEF